MIRVSNTWARPKIDTLDAHCNYTLSIATLWKYRLVINWEPRVQRSCQPSSGREILTIKPSNNEPKQLPPNHLKKYPNKINFELEHIKEGAEKKH